MDLPPKADLWLPSRPAIIRPADRDVLRYAAIPGMGSALKSVRRKRTFATWNAAQAGTNLDYSNGNLTIKQSGSSTAGGSAIATIGKSGSGLYYFELTVSVFALLSDAKIGFTSGAYNQITSFASTGEDDFWYRDDGMTNTGGSPAETTGNTVWTAAEDAVGALIEPSTGKIWFKDKNGSWLTALNDADVAAGNNPDFTGGAGTYFPIAGIGTGANNGNILTANFGATAFAHSVPTGAGTFST